MVGKITVVGVGPGDPELVTRKAERAIREAEILYHPARTHQSSFALRVIENLIGAETEVRAAALEMSDRPNRYATLAAALAQEALTNRRVVFITEGDPMLYSTGSRLLASLQTDFPYVPLEIVPAVTSVTAVASATRCSLAQGNEILLVVPACHYEDELENLMERHQNIVLLKIGSVFPSIVDILTRRGWLAAAVYAEKVGTSQQRIVHDLTSIDPASVSYFSTVVVHRKEDQQRSPGGRGGCVSNDEQ